MALWFWTNQPLENWNRLTPVLQDLDDDNGGDDAGEDAEWFVDPDAGNFTFEDDSSDEDFMP